MCRSRAERRRFAPGHIWVYRGELGEVVYDFTWARNREGPMRMLAGYRGYLQVDAAPAYDDVFAQYPEIIEVACWAHARRYFKEAMPTAAVAVRAGVGLSSANSTGSSGRPPTSTLDAPRDSGCGRSRRGRSWRSCARISRSSSSTALPKSPLGAAIGYALRNWTP